MTLIKFRERGQEIIAAYIRTETTPGHGLEGHILVNQNIHRAYPLRTARWLDPKEVHIWWIRDLK